MVKNEIVLSKEFKIRERKSLIYELETLYKQRPNENYPILPWVSRRWFWYRYENRPDTTKAKRSLKNLGEPPAVFSDEAAYRTAENMKFFLQNRGWFDAEVYHVRDRLNEEGNKMAVTYYVNPKQRYLVDTVNILSEDEQVKEIVQGISETSVLRPGKPVDVVLYEQEVNRISKHLRNTGYAYFYPRYIPPLTGDSLDHRVKIDLEVLLPNQDSLHRRYTVGDVYIYPQFEPANEVSEYRDTMYRGFHFLLPDSSDIRVRPSAIARNVFLRKGGLYSQSDFDRTNNALAKLGVYKIINIREEEDPFRAGVLNFRIYLTPRKIFEIGGDVEINTSGINSSAFNNQSARLVGSGIGLSWKDRNTFKGAELLVINSDLAFDFDVSQFSNPDSLVNTLDFKVQADVYLPRFSDYLGLWRTLNQTKIIKDGFYRRLKEKSSTKIGVGYNFINRFRIYRLNNFDLSYGYEIPQTKTSRYSVTHFGASFFLPIELEGLREILADNPFLQNSFDRQLFTGFLLRNLGYTYTSPTTRRGESYSITGNFELSGLEVWGANRIYNAFSAIDKEFALRGKNDVTSFSQFVLFEGDFRYYNQISPKRQLAYRLYTGIGVPFGFSGELPYIKQFFVGGPNSIRAWRARELGPGGYLDPLTRLPNANPLLFYQTGSFKLETTIEYRFKMFDIAGFDWNGAAFIDAGNVWTLRNDPERPLSKLSWNPKREVLSSGEIITTQENLFKQIAVGVGYGVRIDFLYFIFRLDAGMPVRNPFPTPVNTGPGEEEDIFYWRPISSYRLRDINWNIGLGYSF